MYNTHLAKAVYLRILRLLFCRKNQDELECYETTKMQLESYITIKIQLEKQVKTSIPHKNPDVS